MSRQERLSQSHLVRTSVQSEDFQSRLNKFSKLFQACAGPRGRNHMIRNNCGGHVTVTGSCARILSAMRVSHPELKLLVSSVQAHLTSHGDGGLFLMTACTRLVLASAAQLKSVRPSTLTSLYQTFLAIITSYLNMYDCPVKVKADFSELRVLLQYVRSVLSSKPLLNLTPSDCDDLSRLVLKTFLDSVPSDPSTSLHHHAVSDGVFCLTQDGVDISHSTLVPGLLLKYPDLTVAFGEKELAIKTSSIPAMTDSELFDTPVDSEVVRVSLFTCSMSGDMEEVLDCHYEMSADQEAAVEREVRSRLLRVCSVLEDEQVGLLLCQKVIHPRLKAELSSNGIVYVDRLGSQVFPYLQDLTGADPILSILDLPSIKTSLGRVSAVRHRILSEKSFLWLQATKPSPVSTLVLCAPWEERLDELRTCVRASLHGLSQIAKTKTALMGGGCWIVNCSYTLLHKVMSQPQGLAAQHHCSECVVLTALSLYRASLHAWLHSLVAHTKEHLVVDPTYFHLWRVPQGREETLDSSESSSFVVCCCGCKSAPRESLSQFLWLSKTENQPHNQLVEHLEADFGIFDTDAGFDRVVDSFSVSLNALTQAVSTARLLLSITQFISDKN